MCEDRNEPGKTRPDVGIAVSLRAAIGKALQELMPIGSIMTIDDFRVLSDALEEAVLNHLRESLRGVGSDPMGVEALIATIQGERRYNRGGAA